MFGNNSFAKKQCFPFTTQFISSSRQSIRGLTPDDAVEKRAQAVEALRKSSLDLRPSIQFRSSRFSMAAVFIRRQGKCFYKHYSITFFSAALVGSRAPSSRFKDEGYALQASTIQDFCIQSDWPELEDLFLKALLAASETLPSVASDC